MSTQSNLVNASYDLVVIGGGPAGYAAAIRAGQLGKKVACVELERAGGTCLNWGCIPSKALLTSAELFQTLHHLEPFGLSASSPKADYAAIIARSRSVAQTMANGIQFLFKKNTVDYILGQAQITAPGMVSLIAGAQKGATLSAKNILIATGCKPRSIPGAIVDGQCILTSREFLENKEQPKSVIILGAGAIGVEFAYFLQALGTRVTLVEMLDRILPIEDADVSAAVHSAFTKLGMRILTGSKASDIQVKGDQVHLSAAQAQGKVEKLSADKLILAVGVQANTEGLLAPSLQLKRDGGFIAVDERYKTSIPTVYAAGDIIGPPWLAHVATFEAVQAIEGLFGVIKQPKRNVPFPACTYCQPQIASLGQTEDALREKKIPYSVGRFPFKANGKAVAAGHDEGFVKLLIGKPYGEILGAHIVGHGASELIAEYALAMNSELTAEEVHQTIHAHPTLSEALAEAASLAASGKTVHL